MSSGLLRRRRPSARCRSLVSQDEFLWRVRVRLGLGGCLSTAWPALLSQTGQRGSLYPGYRSAPAARSRFPGAGRSAGIDRTYIGRRPPAGFILGALAVSYDGEHGKPAGRRTTAAVRLPVSLA